MQQNMGTADRIVRGLTAIVIVFLFFTNVLTGTIGIVLLVLAGVFVLTILLGYCPLYALAGISTCGVKGKNA